MNKISPDNATGEISKANEVARVSFYENVKSQFQRKLSSNALTRTGSNTSNTDSSPKDEKRIMGFLADRRVNTEESKKRTGSISSLGSRRSSVEEIMDKVSKLEEMQMSLTHKPTFASDAEMAIKKDELTKIGHQMKKSKSMYKPIDDPSSKNINSNGKNSLQIETFQFVSDTGDVQFSPGAGVEESEGSINDLFPFTPKAIMQPNVANLDRFASYYTNPNNLRDEEDKIRNRKMVALKLLSSLVPRLIVNRAIKLADEYSDDYIPIIKPHAEEYEAGVLFADISGFSALAEKLAKSLNDKTHAAEDLSNYVGNCLELMVKTICDGGGDVVKFAGDAILAVYPANIFDNSLYNATYCCSKVALDLLKLELRAGDAKLSVHCGVGAGLLCGYYVGGGGVKNHKRWEYVITGDPITQIGSAEPEAEAGEVVISKHAYSILEAVSKGEKKASGNFLLLNLIAPTEIMKSTIPESIHIQIDNLPYGYALIVKDLIAPFIPYPVRHSIEGEGGSPDLWISELRVVNTLFIRVKGLLYKGVDDLNEVLETVRGVQEMVYRYEGTLCRFIVDDKGSGLLCGFGLPPAKHEDDPLRAVKSAIAIVKKMQDLNKTASIGVTKGNVFCGTVGGSVRCEYTLHGTNVNLAARLMVAAVEGVLVDEDTYNETSSQIAYGDKKLIKVKGKVEEFPVFRPLDVKWRQEVQVRGHELSMFGRDKEIKLITGAFMNLLDNSSFHGMAVIFTGSMGVGKSRICRFISAFSASRQIKLLEGSGAVTESIVPYFTWRGIFAQLFNFDECIDVSDKIKTATAFFPGENDETISFFLRQLFPDIGERMAIGRGSIANIDTDMKGMNNLMRDAIQRVINSFISSSNEKKKGGKAAKLMGGTTNSGENKESQKGEQITDIALSTHARNRKKLLQQKENESLKKNEHSKSAHTLKKTTSSQGKNSMDNVKPSVNNIRDGKASPMIHEENVAEDKHSHKRLSLLIDDVHAMDSLSWESFLFIIEECENLLTFSTLRPKGFIFFDDLAFVKNVKVYELTYLGRLDVEHMVKELIEIELDKKKALEDSYWENHKLSDAVVDSVIKLSEGHPLYTEELCRVIIEGGELVEKNHTWFLSNAAASGTYKLPDSVNAIMTSKLDKLTKSQKMLIMVASVIGTTFPKNVLFVLFPVEYRGQQFEDDLNVLILHQLVVLSTINGAIPLYKFSQDLLHKTAYESVIFKRRRELHLQIAEWYETANRDYLPSMYNVLAHHFFLAEQYDKAVTYLLESGKIAFQNNDLQQIVSCYSKLLGVEEKFVKHINLLERTSWRRKLAVAFFHQGNLTQSLEYLKESLIHLGNPLHEGYLSRMFSDLLLQFKIKNLKVNPNLTPDQRELKLETARCYELVDMLSDKVNVSFDACLHTLALSIEAMEFSPELARAQSRMVLCYVKMKKWKLAKKLCIQAIETLSNIDDNQKTSVIVKINISIFNIGFAQWAVAEFLLQEAKWVCDFIRINEYSPMCVLLDGAMKRFHGVLKNLECDATEAARKTSDSEVWRFRAEILLLYSNSDPVNIVERAENSLQKSIRRRLNFRDYQADEITDGLPQKYTCLAVWSLILYQKGKDNVASMNAAVRAIDIASKSKFKIELIDFHSLSLATMILLKLNGIDNIRKSSIQKEAPLRDLEDKQTSRQYLIIALELLDFVSQIYPVCTTESVYMKALFMMVENKYKKAASLLTKNLKDCDIMGTPFITGLSYYQLSHIEENNNLIKSKLEKAIEILESCSSVHELNAAKLEREEFK